MGAHDPRGHCGHPGLVLVKIKHLIKILINIPFEVPLKLKVYMKSFWPLARIFRNTAMTID